MINCIEPEVRCMSSIRLMHETVNMFCRLLRALFVYELNELIIPFFFSQFEICTKSTVKMCFDLNINNGNTVG